MHLAKPLIRCLLCDSVELTDVVSLAPMPVCTPGMRVPENVRSDRSVYSAVALDLALCSRCGQVQVGNMPDLEFDYKNYAYRTALSVTLHDHFRDYAATVVERYGLHPGQFAIEIGSNDGTLSSFYARHGLHVLGIDPAVHIAQAATAAGIETIGAFFSSVLARSLRAERGPAALICANNVVANIPDLNDFARGLVDLLADDGVVMIETQYGRDVFERNLLDTVYHEHLSYFFLSPLIRFFARFGLDVIDVERIQTKGGSIRLALAKPAAGHSRAARVDQLVDEERASGATTPAFYAGFIERNAVIRRELRALVRAERERGGRIAGWGVSIGTSTLLAQYELGADIEMLFDDDRDKEPFLIGPDYRIPVYAGHELASRAPTLIIVFAWRYLDFIMRRHPEFLEGGGRFAVPLPDVRIVSKSVGSIDVRAAAAAARFFERESAGPRPSGGSRV